MKDDYTRISVRFNKKIPEHAEILSILKNVNKNFHISQTQFIIEALNFYIRNISDDKIDGEMEGNKDRRDKYATHEYVNTGLSELERSLKLFVYEKLDTFRLSAGHAADHTTNYDTRKDGEKVDLNSNTDNPADVSRDDLSKYDDLISDINKWAT